MYFSYNKCQRQNNGERAVFQIVQNRNAYFSMNKKIVKQFLETVLNWFSVYLTKIGIDFQKRSKTIPALMS